MSHSVASLPISNLDRLNHMVAKREDGGMIIGRALPTGMGHALPMKGLPQKNPREREIAPVNRDGLTGVALKKKGGVLASHPEEKLMMGRGKKSLH